MTKDDIIKTLNEEIIKAHKDGDWDAVMAGLNAILSIDPENAEATSDKGTVLSLMGKNDEAIQYLEKATKLQPNNEELWSNLGCAYSKADRFGDALKAFDKSLEINPENKVTVFNKQISLVLRSLSEEKENNHI